MDYVDVYHGMGSNFHHATIILYSPILESEVSWPANENFFQCSKLFHTEPTKAVEKLHEEIRREPDAAKAKRLGRYKVRLTKSELRDWDYLHAPVAMLTANLAKFEQNEYCWDWLAATGDKPLVEHCKDKTWGDGLDGSGLNLHGRILEVVRVRLC